ncbi:MAG: mechanosensitive ion channel family protein [Lentimicrobium sp.]
MENKTALLPGHIKPFGMFLILACWICIINPEAGYGQNAGDVDPEVSGTRQNTAPVKVDGRTIFYIGGISSYTAEQRAAAISERIRKAANDPSVSPDSVKVVSENDRDKLYAGSRFIMSVFDVDASAEKVSRAMLTELTQKMIAQAIEIHRHERSRPVLIKKALHALGAAVLLVLILYLLLWLIRRLNTGLQKRIKERIESVENISFNLIRSKQLWKLLDILFKTLRISIVVIVIAVFLEYILSLFPWTNNIANYTLNLFLDPIIKLGKGFLSFLPALAFLVVIYFVTRYLLKLIRLLFAGIGQGGILIHGFESDWALPTFKIIRVLVIAFAVIIAFPYIPGSESSAFKGVTVFLGVLFSLGSSSFISNLIAGYSMTYRSAFKKGDRIQVDGQVGFVEEQRLLVTRLRSLKNEEIIIPNSTLLNSNIINYSSRAKDLGLILHTTVGIGYETPWRQVDAMLKLAAYRTEGLLQEPPPFVLKQSLGDFAVNYEINAYCNDANKMPLLYTALHQNILDVFNENNVQIMTPAYEGDPEVPKVVPKDQWNTPLAGEIKESKK